MTVHEHEELMKLINEQPQELHPDLIPYLRKIPGLGEVIQHPLVFSVPHSPAFNKIINASYEAKSREVQRVLEAEEWYTYLFLHERPYRIDAFETIMDRLQDHRYWQLLARIWVDSENIRQNQARWTKLLSSRRPDRAQMMSEEDRAALAAMPETITVYQGHTLGHHDGWSWTTSLTTATWFANRFADMERSPAVVTEGMVDRRHVVAYLSIRGESEILVNRRHVKGRRVINHHTAELTRRKI